MKRRKSSVSLEALSLVLAAIAEVEGWDAEHPSILSREDGSWITVAGKPMPSAELICAIARLENK